MKEIKLKDKSKVLLGLLLTQAISLIGTRMTTVALGIWLYQSTGKTMDLLMIPLFNELPSLLFGNFIGTFVDRLDRKKVIVLADLGQALGSLILLISISSGNFKLIYLYIVVFVQGVFTAGQEPAADATLSLLTTPENRTRVNGIKELSFPAAGVLAPVLAGVFYVSFGIAGVIIIDLTSFVIASAIVLTLEFPRLKKSKEGQKYTGTFVHELKGGFGFLKSHVGLLYLVVYMASINLVINGPIELVIPYVLERTGSELLVSGLLALMSIATFTTSILVSIVSLPKNKMPILFMAVCISGLGLVAFGGAQNTVLLGLSLFLLMMPLPLLNVVFKTILQEKVPTDLQGRVFGSAYQLAYGLAPISFLIVGRLVDNVLEPYMMKNGSAFLIQVFGNTKASAMALVLSFSGLLILVLSMVFLLFPKLKHVEKDLQSYN